MKTVILAAAFLLVGAIAALGVAQFRWRARTNAMIATLAQAPGVAPGRYHVAELAGLPPPVARYFRRVLRDGHPLVRRVRLRQEGEFLVQPGRANGWRPFHAIQDFSTRPAGFVWDARIEMAPLMAVWVRDASRQGQGSMLGAALGLFTVVRMENTPEIATAALQRYLAEACWFPTALLPSAGVVWTAMDDSTARASLTVNATNTTLDFHFRPDGLVERVFALRARAVGDSSVLTPWEGRWSEWAERGGVLIPVRGEVAWLLPDGRQAYWRGRIVEFQD